MNNFPITHEGKTYWIARNMAVSCFVFANINGEWRILANQRGEGAADFNGLWNVPCGYLDFDETTKEAAIREVYEETGIELKDATFWKFEDSPNENLQNVTFRYYSIISKPNTNISVSVGDRGGEENEVNSVAWMSIDSIDNFEWAFNHDAIIKELMDYLKLD